MNSSGMLDRLVFNRANGLIPVAIQTQLSRRIFFLGHADRETVKQCLEKQWVYLYDEEQKKPQLLNDKQNQPITITALDISTEGNSLILYIPERAELETHYPSQGTSMAVSVFDGLWKIIQERKTAMPEGSYTTLLFDQGAAKIGQKVGEEAVELAIAAQYDNPTRTIEEAADLIYHIWVLLASKNLTPSDIAAELQKRMK
jgi:phosphoribosyl-AMP cyclohydrolase / phosphoribosyl-ATP pyrophosphohydrolase